MTHADKTIYWESARKSGLVRGEARAVGTPLISLGPDLLVSKLCRRREKRTMRKIIRHIREFRAKLHGVSTMRKKIAFLLLAFAVSGASSLAQTRPARTTLDIYVVDVEGGNSVLFVSPSGESVLIDTGNVAPGAVRDAERIMAALKDAGVTQIDHLIITHWHGDHFGGLAELAARIPIKQFIDHGPNVQPGAAADEFLQKTYPALYAKATHTVVKPGDKIPVAGLDWLIVASAGQVLKTPLPGAGKPNPYCSEFKPGDNNAEDPQSVGSLHYVRQISYNSFG